MIRLGRFGRWILFGLLCAGNLRGQTPAAPQTEIAVPSDGDSLATLHVYANLIQMPVLVLAADRQRVPDLKPERFALSIDNGPWYQPRHVRPEGADPISLTIVLDFVGKASSLIPKINETIDRASAQLTPRDHVSLMVMQCAVFELLHDEPAVPGLLHPKISLALKAWAEGDRSAACEEKVHLWDTLAVAMLRLSDLPGRRVIIAVTDGVDRGSRRLPDELAVEMQTFAVTTFGVRPGATDSSATIFGRGGAVYTVQPPSLPKVTSDDPLDRICELSGGIALTTNPSNVGKVFARVPELVRKRYILEFPRPSNATAGAHHFEVKVENGDFFLRSSGTSIPLPDPKIAADPTTLPNDPATTPQMGQPKTIPHWLP